MALKGHVPLQGLCFLLLCTPVGAQDVELRLENGSNRCEGRVELKVQGIWGSMFDNYWNLKEAAVVCRQLECGEAVDVPRASHFGAGVGLTWVVYLSCEGTEPTVSDCVLEEFESDNISHDYATGVVCSGFVHLAGGDGPCSGRVEVHSKGDWTPVSDRNFTLPTAHVICAELECGKAASVMRDVSFREAEGQVWAEGFRCKGQERELWSCPRVPCPGGTCRHSGAVHIVCSEYTEVRLMKNGSSQCEGQVEMNLSGGWRALCASHWNMANANVVCRQLGCGVASSAPEGAYFVERGDGVLKHRFHCSGAESFLWHCPVTALGIPDCTHGHTASVICSGNHTQQVPRCNDSVSDPTGSAAWKESTANCSGSRQLRLADRGGRCAGRVEVLHQGSWGSICDDGWDLREAHVVCRQLGCGRAVRATVSAHFGAGSGPIWLDELNCTGQESHVWTCPSRGWGRHDCRHKEDAGVICSEFLALRLVSEDHDCAGWLEVFYNGTWGSVCRSPMEPTTLAVICRQLGCGETGVLNVSAGIRESSQPRWVDGIQCQKSDTTLWQCASDAWDHSSCSSKDTAHIRCAGAKPKSCPTAAPCTDKEKLRLRGGGSACSGRVEVWHDGAWGTVCDDAWSLAEAQVVCQQLGCGSALEALREAAFGPGSGSIWLDDVRCSGSEASLWACAAAPWGRSDCKHEEDAGVRCAGDRTTVPPSTRGPRPSSAPVPGVLSLPGVLCLILGALLFLVLIILATQLHRRRTERRAFSSFEDALDEAVYQEIDYLATPKEDLLGKPGSLSDDSVMKLPYDTGDGEESSDYKPAPGPPHQGADAPSDGYDDAEEVRVPGAPAASQMNKGEVFPEENGVGVSQTGFSLQFPREAVDPGKDVHSPWLPQGGKWDTGYDDVELSVPGTSTMALP